MDPDSYQDYDDDKTSTYSVQGAILHSNEYEPPDDPMQVLEADEDNRPFTSVHYKKPRPAGIPVVFKPNSSNASLWRVNPDEVAKEIIDVAQEKLLSHRMNKDGSLSRNSINNAITEISPYHSDDHPTTYVGIINSKAQMTRAGW
ncbi:hypothetical protein HPB47_002243 [Ixodes persulcatus]|uniref:Uncharacterized protein n=1 Tax=Ixodes persulcatus TaxID=34615 RepID=A0AC60PNB3_IXOPE|nr:hypothetical protein HPB47_002243 [Ixodes persulcatus]